MREIMVKIYERERERGTDYSRIKMHQEAFYDQEKAS